jgi:hydrogenase maturation protease
VDRLQSRSLPPDVKIRRRDRPDAGLLDDLEQARAAVLIDALRTGAPPGHVVRVPPSVLTRGRMSASGGLRIAEALTLAVALERRLPPLRIIGVEIEWHEGEGLSPAVEAAIEPACEAVLAALAELRPLLSPRGRRSP